MASVGSLNPLANAFKKKSFKNTGRNIKNRTQNRLKVNNGDDNREQHVDSQSQKQGEHLYVTKHKRLIIPKISQEDDCKIGPLLNGADPGSMGFQSNTRHKNRELPRYLLHQAPILHSKSFTPDAWDVANQKKMLSLENAISDVSELWETLKKIRDVERKIMEQKGLVDRADSAKDLNDAIVFQGTCPDMCPIFERARRSVENNVVRYEKEHPDDKKISRVKALKVFSRPAAAAVPPLPSDVRPPHVLVKTLDYIVENIIQHLPECESFLWDRMRSIRQDFTYQNYCGPEAVDCNERIVRIHLLILHVMVKADVEYIRQQELEQLHKALITLSEIYEEVRQQGGSCPNEAEFRAYALLSKIRDPEYDRVIQGLPSEIFHNDLVQLAICFRRVISNTSYMERGHIKTENSLNLYLRFFQLIKSGQVPFLMCSFLEVYVNEVRFSAMKALSLTISKRQKNIPFNYFIESLLFNNVDELLSFCRYYSIDTDDSGVSLKSLKHHSHLIPETKPLKQSYLTSVEEKLKSVSLVTLINSGKPNVGILSENSNALLTKAVKIEVTPEPIQVSSEAKTEDIVAGSQLASSSLLPLPGIDEQHVSDPQPTRHTFQLMQNANDGSERLEHFTSNPLDSSTVPHEGRSSNTPFTGIQPFTASFPFSADNHTPQKSLEETIKTNKTRPSAQEQYQEKHEQNTEDKNLASNRNSDETEHVIFEELEQLKEQKEIRNEYVVKQLSDALIGDVVGTKLSSLIKDEFRRKEQKRLQIKTLSEALFNAFIHETLYFIYAESKSDLFYERHVLRKVFKKWFTKYQSSKLERESRLKHKEELQQVGKQLGIPFLKRPRTSDSHNSSTSIIQANSSFMKTPKAWVYTPVATETNHFSTPVRRNSALWLPIDLKEEYCNRISVSEELIAHSDLASNADHKQDSVGLYVYSKNWNSISGSWLLSKFSLNDRTSFVSSNRAVKLSVIKLSNDYNPSKFSTLQLLVFNTGVTDSDIFDLEMKMKQDGEKLIELVHGIALNTNYRFSLLIVFWVSAENPWDDNVIAKYLKLNTIARLFGTIIQSIELCKMNNDRPDEILLRGLVKIAENFRFELTERGAYNRSIMRRNLAGAGGFSHMNLTEPLSDLDEKLHKMIELEKRKHDAYKNRKSLYAHLQNHINASPKLKKTKLPVLLSENHKNRSKTPQRILPHWRSLSESPGSSLTSISSHLAGKVKHLPPSIPTYGTPSQLAPSPSSGDNKLIFQTPSAAILGGSSTSIPIAGTANTSGLSNITIAPPLMTPITQTVLETPPPKERQNYVNNNYDPNVGTDSFINKNQSESAGVTPGSMVLREAPKIIRCGFRIMSQTSEPPQESSPDNREQVPDSVLELKDLIASVKSKLKK
ncbi:Sac3p Ecym_4232 [Eremothecium cymbalariae DBVPG|uniref:Nuclear mRNA export factor n=1 Tax=Eremothecium cymbalariae (strain CBS 270.75 / DBVPG 7215 / KCTC 17166 / NRRL Y-17582) TaxID=931890 RepID=G8JTE6_ERECY|nr:hypothetical protein Ecym_4232 [Eremothecium cymbalariae DBVPG\